MRCKKVIKPWEKKAGGAGVWDGAVCGFQWGDGEDLAEKETSEQKFEGDERVSPQTSKGREFQAEGTIMQRPWC